MSWQVIEDMEKKNLCLALGFLKWLIFLTFYTLSQLKRERLAGEILETEVSHGAAGFYEAQIKITSALTSFITALIDY